jgi:hypothetical protein
MSLSYFPSFAYVLTAHFVRIYCLFFAHFSLIFCPFATCSLLANGVPARDRIAEYAFLHIFQNFFKVLIWRKIFVWNVVYACSFQTFLQINPSSVFSAVSMVHEWCRISVLRKSVKALTVSLERRGFWCAPSPHFGAVFRTGFEFL